MGVVAPRSYYTAADVCYQVSEDFQAAYGPLQTALLETGGMAGSYPAGTAWSAAYDERAGSFVTAATGFARAAQYLGDILIASGYNWECANYAANRDPNKGIGPACPRTIPSELPYGGNAVVGVASARRNSAGLETDFPELFEKVTRLIAGGAVPDGDTERLDRAARAWQAFAASDLATSTASHHTALASLRSEINTQVTATLVGASVVTAATLVWIRNPRSATVEGVAIDAAASSVASLIGAFFATLAGIEFSAAALTTTAFAAITTLSILSIAGDATFDADYKPPANAYDPNGPKAPGRPGDVEGFVPPRGGDRWVPNPRGPGFGWQDKAGRVWVPTGQGGGAHGGPHWDVQGTDGKTYDNVYPGGHRR